MALRRPRHGLPRVLDQPVLTVRPWALLWLPRLLSDNTVLLLSSKVTRIFLLTLLTLTLHFFLSPSSLPSFILFSSFHWLSSKGSTSVLGTHIFCLVFCSTVLSLWPVLLSCWSLPLGMTEAHMPSICKPCPLCPPTMRLFHYTYTFPAATPTPEAEACLQTSHLCSFDSTSWNMKYANKPI